MDPYVQAGLIALAGAFATGIAARVFVPLLPPSEPIDEEKAPSSTAAE